jgi:hypothetical protein
MVYFFNAYLARRFSFERMIHAEFPNIFVLIDFIRRIKKIMCLKSKLVLELPIGGLNFGIQLINPKNNFRSSNMAMSSINTTLFTKKNVN